MDVLDNEELKRELDSKKKEQDIRENFIQRIKQEDSKGTRHFHMGG